MLGALERLADFLDIRTLPAFFGIHENTLFLKFQRIQVLSLTPTVHFKSSLSKFCARQPCLSRVPISPIAHPCFLSLSENTHQREL